MSPTAKGTLAGPARPAGKAAVIVTAKGRGFRRQGRSIASAAPALRLWLGKSRRTTRWRAQR
jgi:hypothetical protein